MSFEVHLPGEAPRPVRRIDPQSPLPARHLVRGSEQLQHLVGARLLVGLSLRAADGALLRQEQFEGTVLSVGDGIVLVDHGLGTLALPADAQAFTAAPPGSYSLRGSGATVVNPDFLTTWDLLAKE